MTDPILVLDQLQKRYRHIRAVEALSLSVYPGEFVALIGPNGAGKTTTMRCIAGQLAPDGGRVLIAGRDAAADPVAARRAVGYVPQDLELYPYLTGEEYLRFIADVRGVEPGVQDQRVEALLTLTELTRARDRILREYSGGMARKLAIAGALIAEPPLLLLDESFVGLDPESTMALRHWLKDYCARGGAVLLSSHILDMLERICSRFLIMARAELRLDLDRDGLAARLTPDAPTLNDLYLTTTRDLR
jgi:ABC-2 type transport system ATP-binding protein